MAKSTTSSIVSLMDSDRFLASSFSDPIWMHHISAANVMDYFAHPENPFYDRHCNNETIRMQRVSLDNLKNMTGTEFVLTHAQEPILFVIKKQKRISPQEVIPLADYYVLNGTIYQAPDLWSVINSRLLNTSHFLYSAVSDLNSYVRYHPSSGYHWDIKNANSTSKISFTPADPTRKATEEAGTQFQRKNVDSILNVLTQKFPPKPQQASQLPFGPRVQAETLPEVTTPPSAQLDMHTDVVVPVDPPKPQNLPTKTAQEGPATKLAKTFR